MPANLGEVKVSVAATLGNSLMPPHLANLISTVPVINRDFLTSGRCIHLNLALAAQIHGAVPDMSSLCFATRVVPREQGKMGSYSLSYGPKSCSSIWSQGWKAQIAWG